MTPEIKEKFLKENGIAIEDAIAHIKKWTAEKNFQSAENGLSELKKFLGDAEEVQSLEKELFEMKNSQKETTKTTPAPSATSSNLNDEDKSERLLAAISYFWFLAILPLVLRKDSQLCQHHGKQGVIFAIFFFVLKTAGALIPFFGSVLLGFVNILMLAVAFYGGMKAYKGTLWKAPMVGDIAEKVNLTGK